MSACTSRCCCWRWCRHRRAPLPREKRARPERAHGKRPPSANRNSCRDGPRASPCWERSLTLDVREPVPARPAGSGTVGPCEARRSPSSPGLPQACSRVQRGAVCQCWLSWVKHVRPGMLHVSLFCSRLSSLRSFFLRFCSRNSHTLSFSCSPFLGAHKATPPHTSLGPPPWSLPGINEPGPLPRKLWAQQ